MVLGFFIAGSEALAKTIGELTASPTAARLGIDNTPQDPETAARLNHTASVAAMVLAIVRERYPSASFGSGLRVEELNEALRKPENGGYATAPGSYHTHGLAFDITVGQDVVGAAKWIRENAHRLPTGLRTVLAEVYKAHVHVDLFDPLGKLEAPRATTYALRQPPGVTPEYGALA